MEFKDLVQPFYNRSKKLCAINGKTSQPALGMFFIDSAIGGSENVDVVYTDDYYGKFVSGAKPVSDPIWEMIEKKFDEDYFTEQLSSRLNEARLSDLIAQFQIKVRTGEKPDGYAFACAVSAQLKLLAECKGNAQNILDKAYKEASAPVDYSEYLEGSFKKYSKLKTLLYTTKEVPMESFYVCNTISTEPVRFRRRSVRKSSRIIENAKLGDLREKGDCTIIVGMGGCGKSMMMRHLFLESVKDFNDTGLLPILVVLRDFGEKKERLWDMLTEAVSRFDSSFVEKDLHRYMKEGRCQILLDGLDEVKPKDLEEFHRQIDLLIDRYPKCQYVMSTRKISSFIGFSQFTILWMEPFTPEQSLMLIDNLKYCEDVPEIKEEFKKQLQEEYFKTHSEFASNPLLLTLMLMSFKRNSNVSDKKYIFYEEAYQTLLRRHDADDKGYYTRPFNSVEELSDFTKVLMEFCAKSYRKGDIDYDDIEFEDYFKLVHAKDRMDQKMMTVENFRKDLLENVCLMYEEERRYHYLHRSFQEYFFAEYYSRADGQDLKKLEKWVREHRLSNYDDGYAFEMLYDLAPDKVEKFIFIPFLDYLFEKVGKADEYWSFLKKGYGKVSYTIVDTQVVKEKEKIEYLSRLASHSVNEPLDLFLTLMLNINQLDPYFLIDTTGLDAAKEEFVDSLWFGQEVTDRDGQERILPMGIPKALFEREKNDRNYPFYDQMIKDENGEIVLVAREYVIDYEILIENPDEHHILVEYLNKPTGPAQCSYKALKAYYDRLKIKYENTDNIDDDDF